MSGYLFLILVENIRYESIVLTEIRSEPPLKIRKRLLLVARVKNVGKSNPARLANRVLVDFRCESTMQ